MPKEDELINDAVDWEIQLQDALKAFEDFKNKQRNVQSNVFDV